ADRYRRHNSVRRPLDRHCWTLLARSIARAHSPPRRAGRESASPIGRNLDRSCAERSEDADGRTDRRHISPELILWLVSLTRRRLDKSPRAVGTNRSGPKPKMILVHVVFTA